MDTPILLSLIIPFYNQLGTLPRLLDSVAARAFPGLEVIVVDDCSDENCADVVDLYSKNGLLIRLLRHEQRRFTKNARISGMVAAAGKYVCFADADDILWGACLRDHVLRMEAGGADVLHFKAVFINEDYTEKEPCRWVMPHGSQLCGKDIFHTFVRCNPMRGPAVWCRMFSKELCMKIVPVARETSVLRYGEDLLLTTLLLFHAEKYLGSEETGYGYLWQPNKPERAAGRLPTMYYILTEVVPYLEKQGCDTEILNIFRRHVCEAMKIWADKLSLWLTDAAGQVNAERVSAIFCNAGSEEFVKIFALCRYTEILAEREKRREIAARRTLPFWKRYFGRTNALLMRIRGQS